MQPKPSDCRRRDGVEIVSFVVGCAFLSRSSCFELLFHPLTTSIRD
jgi:hypothetical protein